MSFLITKVNNFDFTKGYKAYSYCGTVCKRYLLLKRTTDMKTLPKFSHIDSVGGLALGVFASFAVFYFMVAVVPGLA